jgi:GntR family transcriptional regulator/MocR family aminotransferase
VVVINIHLTQFGYDHYDFATMKKVPTGILPIIVVDRKAQKPLHRQIYDAYRTAIVDRRLRSGQRIPSTRGLASELGISRIPVLNAYAQLLAEGYFESRVGAGTLVSSSLPDKLTVVPATGLPLLRGRSGPRGISRRAAILPGPKPFPWFLGWGAFGVGQVAFDHFPAQVWSTLVAHHCRDMTAASFHYGTLMGSEALREAIATHLRTARGVQCEAEQIMIVSGSQQGLDISARVLLDSGDSVWVEQPGYGLIRGVLATTDCRLIPVPVDRDGLNVASGTKQCRNARAAFVTPSHQFPLGVTMSASRRLQLLEWAQREGSWIIEDDYDSEYRYESMPIASLQGLDRNARVIYIGTFSKVLFPSLRLGYLVIPTDLVDHFRAVRRTMDLGPPGLYQAVLADFISGGHFSRHLRRMRMLYRDRRNALVDSIHKELGPTVEVLGAEAGMHLALALPKGMDDMAISTRAARQNLWLWPLSLSYLGKAPRQGFILGFGSTPVEEIPKSVRRLRDLLCLK